MTGKPGPPPDPTSATQLRALFRRHGFRPRRSLGQTFLVDANIVRKIVSAAAISPGDSVLEVGPGAGAVTQHLLRAAGRVAAIEIDRVLVEVLKETVGESAEVICADVLAAPLEELLDQPPGRPWKVVANLPYSITGPAILRLLEARGWISDMIVMVQAEVAERLAAPPGSRKRGWLTVVTEIGCETNLIGRVSRNCFWPRPGVDSAILRLAVRRPPLVAADRENVLHDVVKAAFATRRKTVLNALSHAVNLELSKEAARTLLESCGVQPDLRAEALSAQDFLRLAEAVGTTPEGRSP